MSDWTGGVEQAGHPVERADEEDFDSRRSRATLWFALLAGPVAWMIGLNLDYALVRVACSAQTNALLHGVSLATILLVGAGAWVAWREWTRAGAEWPDEGVSPAARSRFMAMLGLLGSLLFAAVILAQWLAKLFLHPCMAI